MQDSPSIEPLRPYFEAAKTSVIFGSSGIGKSTLVNYLLGYDLQKTQEVSHQSKGRHTTTSRNLRQTKWGGFIIDTPGMRDVVSLDDPKGENEDHILVEALMLRCKFTNCRHDKEPGCAITIGLKDGSLARENWESYQKYLAAEGLRRRR